jgi:hypothetical protein
MVRQASRHASGVLVVMLAVGAAGVLVKAAGLTSKYDAEMRRLRGEWRAAQQAEGLDPNRGAKVLYGKYPTPEITLCKPVVVAPGASAPISVSGKFPPKTTFLVDHDQVTITPGASSPTRYAATAAVAADAQPAFARLFAYAPVSGAWSRCGAVVIGAAPALTLTASNGWTIALTPDGRSWVTDTDSASIGYRAEYFKPGTPAPFEKMTGSLTLSTNDSPGGQYTFSMQPGGTGSAMQEYQELVAKMGDPAAFMKMSAKERAAFEKKMEEVGDRMTKEMEAMSANPSAMIEKQAQFGCGSINLTLTGGDASGQVSCGQKVGSLTLKGLRK